MISIDFECRQGHRFEGYFKDHEAYKTQLDRKIIACPLCETTEISRKYTGCSIQAKSSETTRLEKRHPNLFDTIRAVNQFVRDNFEYVGKEFVNSARAMHYGLEEERNIFGESTVKEIEELHAEGIGVFPLINVEDLEN